MYVLHRPLQTYRLATINASSLKAAMQKPSVKAPPVVRTVKVVHGRRLCEVHLEEGTNTVAELKRRVSHLLRPEESQVMARGKRLHDDDTIGEGMDKVMLIRAPGAAAAAASKPKTLKATLRCLASGRIQRDVELPTSVHIATLLEEKIQPALGLPRGVRREIFVARGRQLLRADLTLADYPDVVCCGVELFVAPNGAEAKAKRHADAVSSNAVAAPGPAGAARLPSGAALPADQRAAFAAIFGPASPEELRALEALSDAAMLGTHPAAAAGVAAAAAASPERKEGEEQEGSAASESAARTRPEGGNGRPSVPDRLVSGRMGLSAAAAGPLGITMEQMQQMQQMTMALDSVPGLREEMEREVEGALGALMCGEGGEGDGEGGGAVGSGAHAATPGEAAVFQLPLSIVQGRIGLGAGGMAGGMAGGTDDERSRERLEVQLGQMVDSLEATEAAAKATEAEAKASQKGFGRGLKAGFLNQPRKKKRRAAEIQPPAAPSTATTASTASTATSTSTSTSTISTTSTATSTSATKSSASASFPEPSAAARAEPSTSPPHTASKTVDVTVCATASPDSGAPPPAKKPASERRRCESCSVRLPLTAVHTSVCRCGALFCSAHLHSHACAHDYRAAAKTRLRASNPEVVPAKL